MATNKVSMKFRSITYPNNDSQSQKKPRGRLQRMSSFDDSTTELTSSTPTKQSTGSASGGKTPVPVVRREVSAEGRLRARQFQHTHSCSATLAPGQKLLRFSDECWYNPGPGETSRPHHTSSVSCLTSPKAKPGSAMRSGGGSGGGGGGSSGCGGGGGSGGGGDASNVERLVDWSRHSPERHALTHSSSQDLSQRHSRSKERRSDRDATSERRSHYAASVSLPPPSKSEQQGGSSSTAVSPSSATPQVSSEGRQRRSQFRRAWSLFSLACDKEVERERREKSPQQRILRPPTRHFYRRGVSGLPIECSTRYLGLAY